MFREQKEKCKLVELVQLPVGLDGRDDLLWQFILERWDHLAIIGDRFAPQVVPYRNSVVLEEEIFTFDRVCFKLGEKRIKNHCPNIGD